MIMYESTQHIELNKNKAFRTNYEQVVVVKVGGSVMSELPDSFYEEIVYLNNNGWFPIIVHGGGPSITGMLKKIGIESTFVDGLRVTDAQTLDVVQMVLNGKENTELVKKLHKAGGKAVGLSGLDDGMLQAEQLDPRLGFVGKITGVNFSLLEQFYITKTIPVISPLALGVDGQVYNVNADTVSEVVAIHLAAKKILMVSDIPGIYQTENGKREILHQLSPEDIQVLKTECQVTKGMIPKVNAAIKCLEEGVKDIYIIDGRDDGIIRKIFTNELAGTKICKAEVV